MKTHDRAQFTAVVRIVLAVTSCGGPARQDPPPTTMPVELAAATFDSAWTVIYRTHPDTLFNGVDWIALREELRPRALNARTEPELRSVVRAMLARLRQSHFVLLPRETMRRTEAGSAGAGADAGLDLRLIGRELVVSRVDSRGGAAAAGVRPGSVLARVDTMRMADIVSAAEREVHRNPVYQRARTAALRLLRGAAGTRVRLDVIDGAGKARAVSVTRTPARGQEIRSPVLPTYQTWVEQRLVHTPAARRTGVVTFNMWLAPMVPALDSAVDAFRESDGLVVDLRGNIGGSREVFLGFAGHLVDTAMTLGTMHTRTLSIPNVVTPRHVMADGRVVRPFAGPLAILIDGLSGSASENFAGSLQDAGRARVFGTRSYGGVLPSATDLLPNGDGLMHAIADYVTARGTRLEGAGVKPDVEIPLTRADLLAGRDAPLEAALRWIDTEVSRRHQRTHAH